MSSSPAQKPNEITSCEYASWPSPRARSGGHDLETDPLEPLEHALASVVLALALLERHVERLRPHRGGADHPRRLGGDRHHVPADAGRVLVVEDALGRHRTEAPDELSEHLALEPGEALFLLPGLVVPAGVAPAPDRQARRLEVLHELWSGWGLRTMSTSDAAYSPLSYHNGTVWPHDTALAAWGLARYGHWDAVHRIAAALLEAARHFEWSLPEVFAGFDRSETPFPIGYPTAARPQAWAAGTPLLLLRLLLGLEPNTAERRLGTLAGAMPPDGVSLSLQGVRGFGRSWDVTSTSSGIGVDEVA